MGRVRLSRVGKAALYYSGLLTLLRFYRQRERAIVLRYHCVVAPGEDAERYAAPDICVPAPAFALEMAFVARAYRVVPLGELADALVGGGPLPPRALAITFDDGYADNYRHAFPILGRLGLPATIFLTTGCLAGVGGLLWMAAVRALVHCAEDKTLAVPGLGELDIGTPPARRDAARRLTRHLVPLDPGARTAKLHTLANAAGVDLGEALAGTMLSWSEVREMAAAGISFGAHTVTHANVALVSMEDAAAEIEGSRQAIEAVTGKRVVDFAYPNAGGAHRYCGPEVARLLRELGFRSAVTSWPGSVTPGSDPLLLPRLGVTPRLAAVANLAPAIERQRLAAPVARTLRR